MRPMTTEEANQVYDVLVEHEVAVEGWRENFVFSHTQPYEDEHGETSEYRLLGSVLGFGAKFWRRRRSLGREQWDVNYYREDATIDRDAARDRANAALDALRASWLPEEGGRVELVEWGPSAALANLGKDEHEHVPRGTQGTVDSVSPGVDQIAVRWDNGSRLSIIISHDLWKKVSDGAVS